MKASLVCAALEPRDGGRAYWFDQMPMAGCSGTAAGNSWVGNVFCQQQAELDAIIADPRTEFSFPIDVIGPELASSAALEKPPAARGGVYAWCAWTHGA